MKDLLAAGDLSKPAALTPTRKVYDAPCTPIDRHGNHATDGIGGAHSASRALPASEALAVEVDLDDDDEEDWAVMSRPRGHSSVAESREARRSSHGEWSAEDGRGRCSSGVDPGSYDNLAGTAAVNKEGGGKGRTSRRKASWKWDLPGRGSDKGGGASSAVNGDRSARRGV